MRASALEVVSIAAKVKVLFPSDTATNHKNDTYDIWPSNSSFDSLSSSDAAILALTTQTMCQQ